MRAFPGEPVCAASRVRGLQLFFRKWKAAAECLVELHERSGKEFAAVLGKRIPRQKRRWILLHRRGRRSEDRKQLLNSGLCGALLDGGRQAPECDDACDPDEQRKGKKDDKHYRTSELENDGTSEVENERTSEVVK